MIPESTARTQRVLGIAGLFALGFTGTLAVIGVVLVTLFPHDLSAAGDAITALSTIAAAAIGALSGWFARGRLEAEAPVAPNPPIESERREIDAADTSAARIAV